jgi:hypothetical protein
MKEQRDGPLMEPVMESAADVAPEMRPITRRPFGQTGLESERGIAEGGTAEGGLEGVFKARAKARGMRVWETPRSDLRQLLDDLVGRHGPAVVAPSLISMFPELDGIGDSTPDNPRLITAACGITGVEYAIAETGSLVMASGTSRWRQFSSVPPVHVAVIERGQLVPDLLDVLLAYGGHHLPPGFVVLTGPSRAAENDQPWRTHRPGTVECVIVD